MTEQYSPGKAVNVKANPEAKDAFLFTPVAAATVWQTAKQEEHCWSSLQNNNPGVRAGGSASLNPRRDIHPKILFFGENAQQSEKLGQNKMWYA